MQEPSYTATRVDREGWRRVLITVTECQSIEKCDCPYFSCVACELLAHIVGQSCLSFHDSNEEFFVSCFQRGERSIARTRVVGSRVLIHYVYYYAHVMYVDEL